MAGQAAAKMGDAVLLRWQPPRVHCCSLNTRNALRAQQRGIVLMGVRCKQQMQGKKVRC